MEHLDKPADQMGEAEFRKLIYTSQPMKKDPFINRLNIKTLQTSCLNYLFFFLLIAAIHILVPIETMSITNNMPQSISESDFPRINTL